MNQQKRLLIFSLSLVFVTVLVFTTSCERFVDLTIENQTDELLNVYVSPGEIIQSDRIQAGEQVIFKKFPTGVDFSIVATNEQGKLVFEKHFSTSELQEVKSGTFKVVIPPLKNGSDNVTGGNTTGR